jgi:hypothetical protein
VVRLSYSPSLGTFVSGIETQYPGEIRESSSLYGNENVPMPHLAAAKLVYMSGRAIKRRRRLRFRKGG